jgi:hypothetical protein
MENLPGPVSAYKQISASGKRVNQPLFNEIARILTQHALVDYR